MMLSLQCALPAAVLVLSHAVSAFSPTSLHSQNHVHLRSLLNKSVQSVVATPSRRLPLCSSRNGARKRHVVGKIQVKKRSWDVKENLSRWAFLVSRWWLSVRKLLTATTLAVVLSAMCCGSAMATTGGRMGGSFGPSQSSHSSMPSTPSPHIRYCQSPRWGCGGSRSHTVVYRSSPSIYYGSRPPTVYRVSPVYVAVMTGVVLYAISIRNMDASSTSKFRSALGPGVSVASLTVALDVPDRDAFDSVLMKLKRLSDGAQTGTRKGVQSLVTDVCLELLRQEKSVVSAGSTYDHFSTSDGAQREFNRLSIQQRGKFDKETVNKYGGIDMASGDERISEDKKSPSRATTAVVTITVSIEGDQTKLPTIRSRTDLVNALSRLASDVPVDDCLQSAEVLWAPELRSETLSKEDLIADYPNLYPI